MNLRTKIQTPSTSLVVSLDELKNQINYPTDETSKDAQFTALIKAATIWAQNYCGRVFLDSAMLSYCAYLSGESLELSVGPVSEISAIEWKNENDTYLELDSDFYSLDNTMLTAYIQFNEYFDAPDSVITWDAIRISYQSGWSTADEVPEDIKLAVLMKAARMFTNPADGVNERYTISESLLKQYKVPSV